MRDEPKEVQSQFSGINNTTVDLDGFGRAISTRDGNTIRSSTELDQDVRNIIGSAQRGLNSTLNFIGRSPADQFFELRNGLNPFFNQQRDTIDRAFDNLTSQARSNFSSRGLGGSTVRGAFEGQLEGERQRSLIAAQQQALANQNQIANQNAAIQSSVLSQILSGQTAPISLASNNLNTALGSTDLVNLRNAQIQAQNQRRSLLPGIIGAGLTLGSALIPGGAAVAPAIGALGSAAASGIGGGGLAGGGLPSFTNPVFNGGFRNNPFLQGFFS